MNMLTGHNLSLCNKYYKYCLYGSRLDQHQHNVRVAQLIAVTLSAKLTCHIALYISGISITSVVICYHHILSDKNHGPAYKALVIW